MDSQFIPHTGPALYAVTDDLRSGQVIGWVRYSDGPGEDAEWSMVPQIAVLGLARTLGGYVHDDAKAFFTTLEDAERVAADLKRS